LQTICRVLDLGLSIEEALAAPRVHQQWRPSEALVESRLDPGTRAKLATYGHRIKSIEALATAQGIAWTSDAQMNAAADSRVGGLALID
jgi:gamma-glutamyltranspeptidase/glutathione hydrolase